MIINKIDTVIFDLDGTLIHTAPEYWRTLVARALRELGANYPGNDSVDNFWFGPDRDEIIKKGFGVEPELFWPSYREHDTEEAQRPFLSVYEDASFVLELRSNDFKIGIVTASPHRVTPAKIEMMRKQNINFGALVITKKSHGVEPKPHPDGLIKCLAQLGSQAHKAIYVGNGAEDIEMAKSAGVLDVLLDRREYEYAGIKPAIRIRSLYDLRPHVGLRVPHG